MNDVERHRDFNGTLERELMQEICAIIRKYNISIKNKLECLVAELCNVDVEDMMTDTKNMQNVQSRWLYWYALRYMTKESYKAISRNTSYERKFTIQCVCLSISKMSNMISANTIWTKRWTILKQIIKCSLDCTTQELWNENKDITIKLTTPKGVKVEINEE